MSYSGEGSSIEDESSTSQSQTRNVGSFLEARDPSITNPWMRPRPTHGTNLAHLFEEDDLEADGVQQLHVFLRVKPPKAPEDGLYEVQSDTALVSLLPADSKRNTQKTAELYKFTHIFSGRTSQGAIFNKIIKNKLSRFIAGRDFTLMSYGASGSGKTYSLMGTDAQPGIIPRCLEFLFAQIRPEERPRYKPADDDTLHELSASQQNKEISAIKAITRVCGGEGAESLLCYRRMSTALTRASRAWLQCRRAALSTEMWVSFAELYNDAAFDLLRDGGVPARLRIVQPANHRPYIKDLRWVCVRSGLEAYAVLVRGRANLHCAYTNVNATSSRSHCIFTMKLVQHAKEGDEAMISTFRLCDLAGLERAKKTQNSGERLNESRKINSSLHILERCLAAMRERQGGARALPPYRESKLTTLLQNALSGQETMAMLVTINPDRDSYEETQHVLKFSALAREILVKESSRQLVTSRHYSEVNSASDASELECLREELASLRLQLEASRADTDRRVREVRTQTVDRFRQLQTKSTQDWYDRLEQEKRIMQEEHSFEVERWEQCAKRLQDKLSTQAEELQEECAVEIKQWEQRVNRLQEELCGKNEKILMLQDENAELQAELSSREVARRHQRAARLQLKKSPSRESNTGKEDTDTCLPAAVQSSPLTRDRVQPAIVQAEVDLEPATRMQSPLATVHPQPLSATMQRYAKHSGLPVVERYFTEKKQKPDDCDKENCESVRRKLFSRHQLDMLAAEPVMILPPQFSSPNQSPDSLRPLPQPRFYVFRSGKK